MATTATTAAISTPDIKSCCSIISSTSLSGISDCTTDITEECHRVVYDYEDPFSRPWKCYLIVDGELSCVSLTSQHLLWSSCIGELHSETNVNTLDIVSVAALSTVDATAALVAYHQHDEHDIVEVATDADRNLETHRVPQLENAHVSCRLIEPSLKGLSPCTSTITATSSNDSEHSVDENGNLHSMKSSKKYLTNNGISHERSSDYASTSDKTVDGFVVYVVRKKQNKWRVQKHVFVCSTNMKKYYSNSHLLNIDSTMIVNRWMNGIRYILKAQKHRFSHILAVVNPFSGKKQGTKVYRKKVLPLLELTDISINMVETTCALEALNMCRDADLSSYSGIIVVGGDGMFNEVLTGLLLRSDFESLNLRLGAIPAGSTNTLAFSTMGTDDVVTSVLHVILGDSICIDVAEIHTLSSNDENDFDAENADNGVHYAATFMGYGFYGDVVKDSEKFRWMGPARYNYSGFRKFLNGAHYSGRLDIKAVELVREPCYADCVMCHLSKPVVIGDKSVDDMSVPPVAATSESENLSTPCDVTDMLNDSAILTTPQILKLKSSNEAHLNDSISPLKSDDNEGWTFLEDSFVCVCANVLSCISKKSSGGLAPYAHLGDGCVDIMVVRKCSRKQYLEHMMRIPSNKDHTDFSFVDVYRAKEFRFKASGCNHSVWNADGEILKSPDIHVKVLRQHIKLFAGGIEI